MPLPTPARIVIVIVAMIVHRTLVPRPPDMLTIVTAIEGIGTARLALVICVRSTVSWPKRLGVTEKWSGQNPTSRTVCYPYMVLNQEEINLQVELSFQNVPSIQARSKILNSTKSHFHRCHSILCDKRVNLLGSF